jgi:hypothetical protein
MDAVREQLKKPLVVGIGGFVVGLILGWFVIGWGLWPVQWTDASPQHLRQDLKEDYLRMAIDSYALNKDAVLAKQRFEELGPDAPQVMQAVVSDPQTQALAVAFAAAIQAEPGAVAPVVPGLVETPTPEATPKPSSASLIRNVLLVMCGAVLLIAAGLVALYFLRQRQVRERAVPPTMTAQPAAHEAEWSDYEAGSQEPPMVQFMASYKLGDDLFDDSFSIDSPTGEFLGECGVGISETIGVGDPKKVTAFEAWLFDKNDIQTVTKVLMSEHAFHDEGIYQRLSAKGEPILAEPGAQIVLETQTLQMVVRVVDMGYGDGALPPQSYFDRLVLELAVWAKIS